MTRRSGRRVALVTGGAGFIGSHLAERLLKEGCAVRVLDNFSTGRRSNLAHLRGHPGLSIHRADVARGDRIRPLFSGAEWVFHLAAQADIVPSVESPRDYHRSNVEGTVAVLEASRAAGVRRFVYAASSSCYGIPDRFPTPESAPARPMYPYALTKWVGEQYVLHWSRVYRLPCVSLRLFNVYGPRSRTGGAYGAVFGVFLAQKLAGRPLTVVGDGTQTRDFTFVTDVAGAFLAAARSGLAGEALNVGSGRAVSVNRLAGLLGGRVVHIPKRPGEPDRTLADISRIRRALGWRPRVRFEDGVRVMLERLSDYRGVPVWSPASIARATRVWFKHLKP